MRISKHFILIPIVLLLFGYGVKSAFAETSPSVLYVPLIGITSVPEPLALPKGPDTVTYHYAVKNFLREVPLTDVGVVDDKCSPITFVEGDDNNDAKLDYNETWRYVCNTKIATTTESIATVTGTANGITATHKAYATVVVGSNEPHPLVSIVNITKVAYPLSLPAGGGDITYTYKVTNPGVTPLSNVTVIDDKCGTMSGKLGDTNGNNLLDINEAWIYTCTSGLTQTTTNIARVSAFANGLEAVDVATLTVNVGTPTVWPAPDLPFAQPTPSFPETGGSPNAKIIIWGILCAAIVALVILMVFNKGKTQQ